MLNLQQRLEREFVRKWEGETSDTGIGKRKVREIKVKGLGPEKVVWNLFFFFSRH